MLMKTLDLQLSMPYDLGMEELNKDDIRAQVEAIRRRTGQGFIEEFMAHAKLSRSSVDRLLDPKEKVSIATLKKALKAIETWGDRSVMGTSVAQPLPGSGWEYLGKKFIDVGHACLSSSLTPAEKNDIVGTEIGTLAKLFQTALGDALKKRND